MFEKESILDVEIDYVGPSIHLGEPKCSSLRGFQKSILLRVVLEVRGSKKSALLRAIF